MATRQPQPAAAAEQDRQPCKPSIHRQLQAISHPEQPWGAPDRSAPLLLARRRTGQGEAPRASTGHFSGKTHVRQDSTPIQSNTDATGPPSGKNPHGSEVERIHNKTKQHCGYDKHKAATGHHKQPPSKQSRGTTSNHAPQPTTRTAGKPFEPHSFC